MRDSIKCQSDHCGVLKVLSKRISSDGCLRSKEILVMEAACFVVPGIFITITLVFKGTK